MSFGYAAAWVKWNKESHLRRRTLSHLLIDTNSQMQNEDTHKQQESSKTHKQTSRLCLFLMSLPFKAHFKEVQCCDFGLVPFYILWEKKQVDSLHSLSLCFYTIQCGVFSFEKNPSRMDEWSQVTTVLCTVYCILMHWYTKCPLKFKIITHMSAISQQEVDSTWLKKKNNEHFSNMCLGKNNYFFQIWHITEESC